MLISEYNRSDMSHPGGWWSELVEAMTENYDTTADAIHDLTLLTAERDWEYVDETSRD